MARAIIGGLLAENYPAELISASEPLEAAREAAHEQFGIGITHDNQRAAEDADIVILAVKPQQLADVATALASSITAQHLVVSIAAGIRAKDLETWLGMGTAIVRVMPNTPALVGKGASVLFANAPVSVDQKRDAESILASVGTTAWVDDEQKLNAVTALSGSGPAYFFLLIELLEASGIELGLDPDLARNLALQTALGASSLARSSPDAPAELRRQVTSPGGTTAAALAVFEAAGLAAIVAQALGAADSRSQELADEFGA